MNIFCLFKLNIQHLNNDKLLIFLCTIQIKFQFSFLFNSIKYTHQQSLFRIFLFFHRNKKLFYYHLHFFESLLSNNLRQIHHNNMKLSCKIFLSNKSLYGHQQEKLTKTIKFIFLSDFILQKLFFNKSFFSICSLSSLSDLHQKKRSQTRTETDYFLSNDIRNGTEFNRFTYRYNKQIRSMKRKEI